MNASIPVQKPVCLTMTEAEIHALLRSHREDAESATTIVGVGYDRAHDMIGVDLSTGAALAVPRAKIAAFRNADSADLADLTINPSGASLWSNTVDDGVSLEQLFQIAVGPSLTVALRSQTNVR